MWWNSCLSSSVHTWRNSGLCLSFKDSKHFLNRCASFATLLANSITVEENALVRPFPVFVGPFALLYVSSCCFFLRFFLNNICIYASSSSLHWSAYPLLYLFVISCISPSMFLCSWLIYYIMCSSYLVLDSLLYLGSTRVSNPVKKRFWSNEFFKFIADEDVNKVNILVACISCAAIWIVCMACCQTGYSFGTYFVWII